MERKYNSKDVDMLMTCNVVMRNFNRHKTALVAKRKSWKDPFAKNLQQRIDNGLSILGVNTKTEQKQATNTLTVLQDEALENLVTFKVQLEVDFEEQEDRLELIESQLGFTQHYKKAQSGDQEALIQLLSSMKENLTPQLKKEIEAAGTDGETMEDLIKSRDEIAEANIKQEALKGSSPNDTALNVEELNGIYKQVIGICKIAPRLLPDVPTAADEFSFRKILNRLG